jgi:hypothetical protein
MCDGYGEVVGIRLRNERGKFAVRGSRQGVFVAGVPAQKTLFVCEGPTDTAAAVDLGLFAVGRPNCCCGGRSSGFCPASRCFWSSSFRQRQAGPDGAKKVKRDCTSVYVPLAKDLRVRPAGRHASRDENTLKGTGMATDKGRNAHPDKFEIRHRTVSRLHQRGFAFFRLFVWLDEQSEDGTIFSPPPDADEIGGLKGFGEALQEVRLAHVRRAARCPTDRHNGQPAVRCLTPKGQGGCGRRHRCSRTIPSRSRCYGKRDQIRKDKRR